MIRIITFIAICLVISAANPVAAQDAVKTGAKGGLNFATITDGDFETRTGFVVGGFAKFTIPDSRLSIQPEALYSQQGGEIDGNEVRLDYLKVPVLFKFDLATGGTVEPNVFAGPYAGLRLIAEQDGGTGGLLGGSSSLENETESVDYGAVFG
ncbi:MAG: porin family protein, partial [Balneolaceae bacterium]